MGQGMELYNGKLICYSLGILTMPFLMEANFELREMR